MDDDDYLYAGAAIGVASLGAVAWMLFRKPVRRWPVSTYRGILSPYGVQRAGGAERHPGADLGAFPGDQILALDDGVVLKMVGGYALGGGLEAVAIRHRDADYNYAEIKVTVAPGQKVKAGDPIGYAAKNSDGNSMLHLEAWEKGMAPDRFARWNEGQKPPGLLDVGLLLASIPHP